jgi:hypothetical protein
MLIWLLAAVVGSALAVVQYRFAGGTRATVPLVLRATALTIVGALLLDAPIGPAGSATPYVALDASSSWLAAGDSALWARARRAADSLGTDTLLLVGDSVRAAKAPALPADAATRVAPLVERALGAGRPVFLVSDGRLDDPDRLRELPAGSKVVTLEGPPRRDGAIASLDGAAAVVAGDSVGYTVVVAAGSGGAGTGRLEITLDGAPFASAVVDSLAAYGEREIRVRSQVVGAPGSRVLTAVLTTAGDLVPRNDTLRAVLEVARGASAVFVSTSPDFDARYALEVLRGTLAVPTRGYFRVSPGQWRVDGALTAVAEEEVKRAFAEAPMAILHGDTAIFGAPRALTKGSLALLAPPTVKGDDYYAVAAPPSPLASALVALPWDSLPPVELGNVGSGVEWVGVSTRRARRLDERALVVGYTTPRRIVVVPASGLFRWRFRGGRSADAFTALWGSIFDWMTGDANDARAARAATPWIRTGEPVRWRRGNARDSSTTVVVRAKGAARADSLRLRFSGEAGLAESPSLAPGVYETKTGDATGLLAVNVSSEWVPRRPNVQRGAIGGAAAGDRAPRARSAWWLSLVALAALSAEWIIRRRIGLR